MAIYKSAEWRENISRAKRDKIPYIASTETREKFRKSKMGNRNPNWRGGITSEYKRIRESAKYREWRKKVFERDGWACVKCGDRTGGNLEADHIKPFAYFPELRFELLNGRTLCRECHKQTDTWGIKALIYKEVDIYEQN